MRLFRGVLPGALTLTLGVAGVHGEGYRQPDETALAPPPTPWVKPKGGGSCATDFDCNLAGECDQHRARTCYCDAAWTGSRCQYLDGKPNRGTAALRQAHSSSWGGRPVVESQATPSPPKTLVHGFFSVLGGSCGMNLWDNVSFIAHTTSDSPNGAGPHVVADVAIPTFASCVDHVTLNDTQTGEELYVLFHNGDGQPRACSVETPDCSQKPIGWIADCSGPGTANNGTTPDANVTAYPASPPPVGFIPSNGVHVSNDPAGPWQPPVPGAVLGYPYCDCPAVHALRNGSVVVWCQAIEFNYTSVNTTISIPQLFINQGWGTPFEARNVSVNIPIKFSEIASRYKQVLRFDEPTLWVDKRGNWHALMHNGDGFYPCGDNRSSIGALFRDNNPFPIGCTAHFFSSDGLNWYGFVMAHFVPAVMCTLPAYCCPLVFFVGLPPLHAGQCLRMQRTMLQCH